VREGNNRDETDQVSDEEESSQLIFSHGPDWESPTKSTIPQLASLCQISREQMQHDNISKKAYKDDEENDDYSQQLSDEDQDQDDGCSVGNEQEAMAPNSGSENNPVYQLMGEIRSKLKELKDYLTSGTPSQDRQQYME
jgi:hypothetical protein